MSRSQNNGIAVEEKTQAPKAKGKEGEAKNSEPKGIVIPAPDFAITRIKIVGEAPLISNAFPKKLLEQWKGEREVERLANANRQQRGARPARNYREEFESAMYPLPEGGYGFPAMAFKHAIVGACRQVDGIAMTLANRLVFVMADSSSRGTNVVRIIGTPEMEEVMARNSDQDKTPDLRIRGKFLPWSCWLSIKHNRKILPVASLLNLVQIAGISEGVGENRPSSPKKAGDNGVFRLAEKGE